MSIKQFDQKLQNQQQIIQLIKTIINDVKEVRDQNKTNARKYTGIDVKCYMRKNIHPYILILLDNNKEAYFGILAKIGESFN